MPREERFCAYCPAGQDGQRPVDTEVHCLTECTVGAEGRQELYDSFGSNNSTFGSLCNEDKFKNLVCPYNPSDCKAVNRYLQLQFKLRDSIDTGECTCPV